MFKTTQLEVISLKDFMIPIRGNITLAAKVLKINRGTLRKYYHSDMDCYIIKNGDGYKFLTEIQSNRGPKH